MGNMQRHKHVISVTIFHCAPAYSGTGLLCTPSARKVWGLKLWLWNLCIHLEQDRGGILSWPEESSCLLNTHSGHTETWNSTLIDLNTFIFVRAMVLFFSQIWYFIKKKQFIWSIIGFKYVWLIELIHWKEWTFRWSLFRICSFIRMNNDSIFHWSVALQNNSHYSISWVFVTT